MSRDPSPSLDIYLDELVREELGYTTKAIMEWQTISTGTVAFAMESKPRNRNVSKVPCYHYKEYDRITKQCMKKF